MEKISKRLFNWASILDEKTRQQAETTASMPFIYPHLALMPDAHLGKGATVGSVIPTLGTIIPAAVGVDIGCVDAETEYLSPNGWRRIDEYEGEQVMQYDPETRVGNFVKPDAYIVKPAESFYRLKSKYGIDQMLTPDHKMLVWQIEGRERRRVMKTMTAEEFAQKDGALVQGYKAEFATTFTLDSKGAWFPLSMPDDEIRLRVMVSADARFEGDRKIVLRFKKERKIERAQEILNALHIPFTFRVGGDGVTNITFRHDLLHSGDRRLSRFWRASAHQLTVLTNEVFHWDGNLEDRTYFTRIKENADLVQYAFTVSGYRAAMRGDVDPKDGKIDYRVFANPNTMVGMYGNDRQPIELVPSLDGKAYCFTVPTGFWVMRRGGNVVITGNCGMIAVRTDLTADQLPTDRKPLRQAIERAIPLSAGGRNNKIVATAEPKIAELERLAALGDGRAPVAYWNGTGNGNGRSGLDGFSRDWRYQLGTLGSGNHFIEVTVDEEQRVWLFLHSGSRGVGNRLAQRHIEVAQEYCEKHYISLPDKDLAYLVEGTLEFDEYITDLQWAQRFAFLNREEMMDRVIRQFTEWVGIEWSETERINCHHNYTTQEHVFGRDVWLSRKGAIAAHAGTPGLIPGSMGTASYVVEGKGNALSLNSSPHGAGREYSRSKARKTFTMEQLVKDMEGIEWRQSDAFLDEIPAAYKRVETVMEDAADLVKVKHTLRQIVNVKGN